MSRRTTEVDEHDHVQGSGSALVTLVEYGDYECSHCGYAFGILKAVRSRMGNRLRFVFRNFPLTQVHVHAELAAEAAEAAGAQGRFWEMHDALFENQSELTSELVIQLARVLGLDVALFAEDIRTGRFRQRVRSDFKAGVRSGVAGTPTFFINGERFDGEWSDTEEFIAVLERAAAQGQ